MFDIGKINLYNKSIESNQTEVFKMNTNKYLVKLIDHYNGNKVFNESEFANMKDARNWAKGKAFGLRYTVEIYNLYTDKLQTNYITN
jgi:hypothetical protein